MVDHKIDIGDGAQTEDKAGSEAETSPNKKKYIVTDKTVRDDILNEDGEIESRGSEGIFKNGQLYKPGDEIELDDQSAENFKQLGEIKDV